jgi:tetratricopeptide (TPR) repeat protein
VTLQPGFERLKFDRLNALTAFLVFVISLLVYIKTVAPTMSFWDCGEFIACSYILGIPHPPGFPLYTLVGRVFSILPLATDISMRVNLLSSICSAFTALFAYLIIVRLIRQWHNDKKDFINRFIAYIGGFTGALFTAFSTTNWANSVEAEVYTMAMMFMLCVYWLALKYYESPSRGSALRAMLLGMFIGVLGIGIHLSMFLVVPVAGLYIILKNDSGPRAWALVSLFFLFELYLILQLSSRPGELPYYLPVLLLFVIFIFHQAQNYRLPRQVLITGLLFLMALYKLLFTVIGLVSVNLTGSGLSSSLQVVSEYPVDWIGLIALTIWGIFTAYKYYSLKSYGNKADQWLIVAVYSITPAFLILVGRIFSGYYSFLALTAMIALALAYILRHKINWQILISIASVSLVIVGFWQFIIGLVIGSIAIVILSLVRKDNNWRVALSIILLAIIGYSAHIYIPIRSAHNPAIDENNPSESFTALVNYLERKQYGSVSMTERMFKRRGEWSNQFGDFHRMGFWYFFKQQFGFDGVRVVIVLILGMFGIWETIRRKPAMGLPFLVFLVLSTIGMVLYMNFADGTRQNPLSSQDYIEVRDRDYFFVAGFVLYGLAIGMGLAAVLDLIRDTLGKKPTLSRVVAICLGVIFVLLPAIPLKANYFENDRSRNFMAYDYADNLMRSCHENSILINYGDNDTFPTWCIQEVYGVRKDVRIVNLSLGNMSWYIKQLRSILKVPLSWSDSDIDNLRPYRTADGTAFRIQDQLIDEILEVNQWRHPVHFTVSTPESNIRYRGKPLTDYLVFEGMIFNVVPQRGKDQMNFEKVKQIYWHENSYRGVNDSSIFKDDATRRLTSNYAQGFLWLADTVRKTGDLEGAMEHVDSGLKVLSDSWDLYSFGAQLLSDMGNKDSAKVVISALPEYHQKDFYMRRGMATRSRGDMDESLDAFETLHSMFPDYEDGFRALAAAYYKSGNYIKLRKHVINWLARHPNDLEAQQLYRELQKAESLIDTINR